MSRCLRLLPSSVVVIAVFLLSLPPAAFAQTQEENDEAAAEARRENTLPLITTRTLDFTTDEGTWISLD
ncbi:MAG: hypothetical protein IH849_11030, partial [Acidobacteria bacterium]|nr:hypothetical protein [Acidobacteriota bacterium]